MMLGFSRSSSSGAASNDTLKKEKSDRSKRSKKEEEEMKVEEEDEWSVIEDFSDRDLQQEDQRKEKESDRSKSKKTTKKEESNKTLKEDQEDSENQKEEEDNTPPKPLWKSSRFKGYLILLLASSVNCQSAIVSNSITPGRSTVVTPTEPQRAYAVLVSIVSILVTSLVVLIHIDRWTPMVSVWNKIFTLYEGRIILGPLVFWWLVATWIQTSVRGIAGDGKNQYNLYFSTWACLFASLWTLERWVVSHDLPSLEAFLASWPHRAPGWIAIFIFSMADLLCIVDLFLNGASSRNPLLAREFAKISNVQWEWLLFVVAFTAPLAAGFILVELFRVTASASSSSTSSDNEDNSNDATTSTATSTKYVKSDWETILEGFILLILVFAWIPSVIVATTPGGVAAYAGNAYFFTWGSTVFVMETSVWWIHDWRKRIHSIIQEQEDEYQKIKNQVKKQSLAIQEQASQESDDEQHVLPFGTTVTSRCRTIGVGQTRDSTENFSDCDSLDLDDAHVPSDLFQAKRSKQKNKS